MRSLLSVPVQCLAWLEVIVVVHSKPCLIGTLSALDDVIDLEPWCSRILGEVINSYIKRFIQLLVNCKISSGQVSRQYHASRRQYHASIT